MRRQAILLLLAVILIIGSIAAVAVVINSQFFMAKARDVLVAELSKSLAAPVTVGKVEIEGFNSIVLNNIAIYDQQGTLMAASSKLTVNFKLWDILRGNADITAISKIKLAAPQLYLSQDKDNSWIYEFITKQYADAQTAKLAAELEIAGGQLNLNTLAGKWQADEINGTISLPRQSGWVADLSGMLNGAKITVEGAWSENSKAVLDLTLKNADLAAYRGLIEKYTDIHLQEGKLRTLTLRLHSSSGSLANISADIDLAEANAEYAGYQLQGLQGTAKYDKKILYLLKTGSKVAGQPVEASGQIGFSQSSPWLNITAKAQNFDLAAVIAEIPLTGGAEISVNVTGSAGKPVIAVNLRQAGGQLAGYQVKNTVVNAHIAGNTIELNRFDTNILGGLISAAGTIDKQCKAYYVQIKGKDIDTAAIGGYLSEVTGRGNFEVLLDGKGDIKDADFTGYASIEKGSVKGAVFDNVNLSAYKQGNKTTIDYINIVTGQGRVTGSGEIDKQRIKAVINGTKFPLQSLSSLANNIPVSGTAEFTGTCSGTIDKPLAVFSFTGKDGAIAKQPFKTLAGNGNLENQNVTIEKAELLNGKTNSTASGSISLGGRREINLSVKTNQARAEDLLQLAGSAEKLTGNVDNELRLTGTMENISAAGHLVLTEGRYRGYLIARAEGSYQQINKELQLQNFIIQSLNTQACINGRVLADNTLDIEITAQDIDLAKLQLDMPYPMSGEAGITGKVSGKLDYPKFEGRFSAAKMTFNGQLLENASGNLQANKEFISIPSLSFTQQGGKFSFNGWSGLKTEQISGLFIVENAEMAGILPLMAVPDKGIKGKINGEIIIAGTMKKPNIWLTGNLTAGEIKEYPLQNINVDIAFEDNVLKINTLTAQQGKGTISVKGSADLKGSINMEIGGRDIDAGLLSDWFDTSVKAKGNLNFAAQLSGHSAEPHADVSLEIKNGGAGNAVFDNLVGLLIFEKGSIHVNQLLVNKGEYKASVYGVIPVKDLNRSAMHSASDFDQMNLNIKLDQANLSILPMLTNEVSWADGATQGEVRLSGTLAQPLLYGKIFVSNGTVQLASFSEPVQKVGVDIQFEGDKINVANFTGQMGAGKYNLTGNVLVDGLEFNKYNLSLKIDNAKLSHKYFKGPVNGLLTLTNDGNRPKLAGKLDLDYDTISLPGFDDPGKTDLDLGLELEINLGHKTHFYNSKMYDKPYAYDFWTDGQVLCQGTVRRPAVSGSIKVSRGTISYLTNRFNITQGSAEFVKAHSFIPVIHLEANTKLQQTTIELRANGDADKINFDFFSDPPMSHSDIMKVFTMRSNFISSGSSFDMNGNISKDDVMSLFNAGMTMGLVADMENTFRNALGLDCFSLTRNINTLNSQGIVNQGYQVEIGKYIGDKFMVNYTFGINNSDSGLSFRYDLSKRLSVGGSFVDNTRKYKVETRISF